MELCDLSTLGMLRLSGSAPDVFVLGQEVSPNPQVSSHMPDRLCPFALGPTTVILKTSSSALPFLVNLLGFLLLHTFWTLLVL